MLVTFTFGLMMTFQDLKMHQNASQQMSDFKFSWCLGQTIFHFLTPTLQTVDFLFSLCKIVFSFQEQLLPQFCKMRICSISKNFQKATSESISLQGFQSLSKFFFCRSMPQDTPSKAVLVCPPPCPCPYTPCCRWTLIGQCLCHPYPPSYCFFFLPYQTQ